LSSLTANCAAGVADITSLLGFEFGTSPTPLLQAVIAVVTNSSIIFDRTETLFSYHKYNESERYLNSGMSSACRQQHLQPDL
jgi:hypothetical protein